MEHLSKRQLRVLRENHPRNNRPKFFDAVSSVIITGTLTGEKAEFLQEMTKLDMEATVRIVNA